MGHPSFGKAVPCGCQRRDDDPSRAARLRRYSNMGPLSRVTFQATITSGNRSTTGDQDLFRQGYEHAKAYAEDPRGWLVLTGQSGSGKTHLAAAIANRVLESGRPVFFIFVPDLLDHLRSTYAPSSETSFDQLFEQVRNAPFLVLDDLGGHNSTPWAQEKLNQILNSRHSNRMPTVFTLGVPVEDLDPRWQTRLTDTEIAATRQLSVEERGEMPGRKGLLSPELLAQMTFDSFDVRGNRANRQQRESLERAFRHAMNYAQNPEGWLLLLGPTGCGKTHLVHAIANERLKLSHKVLHFQVADLMDYLRFTYKPDSAVTSDRLFEEVQNVSLLILEDFNIHNPTPWAREKLYQVIVHRHNSRLPTIITTNALVPGQFGSDPIYSRLTDRNLSSIIPIDAPDYREGEWVSRPQTY